VLTVKAYADEVVDVTAVAGAGSVFASLGLQYAEADVRSSQKAFIGAGANVLLADEVNVLASHDRDLDANSTGGGVAAGVAAGVSTAKVIAGGRVNAVIGVNTLLGEVDDQDNVVGRIGNVNIYATSTISNATAVAYAAAGGILAGLTGNISLVEIQPKVKATVNGGARVYADGEIRVTAQTDQNADAAGFGLAIGGGASAGVSVADATIFPTITTLIGNGAQLVADEVVVEALHNIDTDGGATGGEARVETIAASAAILVSANGTDATADSSATVGVQIGSATLFARRGDLVVQSLSRNQVDAKTDGNAGAIIGVGIQNSRLNINTNNQLQVLDGAQLVSQLGDVTILARSSEDATIDAVAGSGGLLAISESRADVDVTQNTVVSVGAATIEAGEKLTITSSLEHTADVRSTAESFALLGAIPTSRATLDINGSGGPTGSSGVLSTNIIGAQLRADQVIVTADIESIVIELDGLSTAFAIGTDSDASGKTRINLAPLVFIDAGTEIVGGTSVLLRVDQNKIDIDSDSKAVAAIQTGDDTFGDIGALFGSTDSNAMLWPR